MKPFARWFLLAGIWVLPYLVVLLSGWIWLVERGWIFHWVAGTAAVTLVGLAVSLWWDRRREKRPVADVPASDRWPPEGKRAWQRVEELAARARREQWPVSAPEDWLRMLRETLEAVSREFHRESREPLLEVCIPHLLKVVELVAADLRHSLTHHVPGIHLLTLRQMLEMQRLWQRGYRAYAAIYPLYQIARILANLPTAVIREASAAAAAGIWRQSVGDVRAWLVDYTIKKAGYYAIQLYSGQLVLDENLPGHVPPPSKKEIEEADEREHAIEGEPLRVIVMGQVKAGKSSLVNALFGQTKAAVDVLPATAQATAYKYERDGLPAALVIDMAGYGGDGPGRLAQELETQIAHCDMVLLVVSATNAAREADRRMLVKLRELTASRPRRAPPPVVAVLTHIDLLRPWGEWSPPYDIAAPQPGSKAANIAAAVEAVAQDLGVGPQHVVPVSLREGAEYNVDACLLAIAAAAPKAERARYLRAIEAYKSNENLRMLWEQIVSGGRLLLGKAAEPILERLGRFFGPDDDRTTDTPNAGDGPPAPESRSNLHQPLHNEPS